MKQITFWIAMSICAVLLFVLPGVYAADNGVLPFSFSSGTTAKASEVNENFQFVNHGNLVVIDGTGAELGTPIYTGNTEIRYLNNNGFIVKVSAPFWSGPPVEPPPNPNVITIADLNFVYITSDCSGTAYVPHTYILSYGIVYSYNGLLYYIAKNQGISTTINYNSIGISGACNVQSGTAYVYPVVINDPSVTGESSLTKTPPLRIIRRVK